jgi:hypothetical protein
MHHHILQQTAYYLPVTARNFATAVKDILPFATSSKRSLLLRSVTHSVVACYNSQVQYLATSEVSNMPGG